MSNVHDIMRSIGFKYGENMRKSILYSNNMTDQYGALSCMAQMDNAASNEAIRKFYDNGMKIHWSWTAGLQSSQCLHTRS